MVTLQSDWFARQTRLMPVAALFVALGALVGLGFLLSASPGTLSASLARHDAELAEISEEADGLYRFTRYIQKVSFAGSADSAQVPFAGFAGDSARLLPGRKLSLGQSGMVHQFEIIATERINSSIGMITTASRQIELVLVTGRSIADPDGQEVRFIVAVEPIKRAPADVTQHSL